MCGIAGLFLTSSSASEQSLQGLAERQDRALVHRGPDAGAQWVDQQAGLSLSHRRLAILDLSPAGAQPMVSDCGLSGINTQAEPPTTKPACGPCLCSKLGMGSLRDEVQRFGLM